MKELQVFENEQFGQIRTIEQNGQTWFAAADVCGALEISNPSQALSRLDDDEKFTTLISNEGAASGKSQAAFVNEPGLYTLVLSSRKPEAKAFKRWITHEVLPSIHRHGMYATDGTIAQILDNPDFGIELLNQIKQEREARCLLEEQARADAPKVRLAEAIESAGDDILIGEMAKILAQNGVATGEKRLFNTLRGDGYLIRSGTERNMPTQRSIELGVMRIIKRAVMLPDGRKEIRKTPKITAKGQTYFLERYAGEAGA